MAQDTESLQPWQIFCSMFAVFWLVSAWCDQVIITLVLCIVFGVISDIVTKNMYSASPAKTEPEPEKEINVEEVKESNEKIWKKAEAELAEADNDVPPPLPDKDYNSGGNIDLLADKLQALAATEDIAFAEESDEDEEEKPEPSRQYNRTVSDEYNQNTSTLNFNKESIIEEEVAEVAAADDSDESEEEEKKVYAKDSSDEDDYDYASREVNFDESETDGDAEEDTDDLKDAAKPIKTVKDLSDDE